MATGKKGGRPLKHPGEPLSKAMAFRLRPRLAELLQAAAEKHSRTLSQEIERRLEQSFQDERLAQAQFGTDIGAEILRTVYSVLILEGIFPDWDKDPARAQNFRVAMNGIIAGLLVLPFELPSPEKWAEGVETARQFLARFPERPRIRFAHYDPTADGDPYKLSAEEEPATSKPKKTGT